MKLSRTQARHLPRDVDGLVDAIAGPWRHGLSMWGPRGGHGARRRVVGWHSRVVGWHSRVVGLREVVSWHGWVMDWPCWVMRWQGWMVGLRDVVAQPRSWCAVHLAVYRVCPETDSGEGQ